MAVYTDLTPRTKAEVHVGYKLAEDIQAIENSIKNLFTIEIGEVPGKPWLGNPISVFLFDNMGFFEEKAMEVAMQNVLEKYEPRARLISIKINKEQEYNYLEIVINYVIYINSQEVFRNLSISHNTMTSIAQRNKQI